MLLDLLAEGIRLDFSGLRPLIVLETAARRHQLVELLAELSGGVEGLRGSSSSSTRGAVLFGNAHTNARVRRLLLLL